MTQILVNDFNSQRSEHLQQALIDAGYSIAGSFSSETGLLKIIDEFDPDLIVIDVEQASPALIASLKQLNELKPKPIVIFADTGDSDIISSALDAGVSAFIVNGFSAQRIQPVVTVAQERFKQTQVLKSELHKAKTTLAERKIIEKAKGIIMKQRGVNEDSAFRLMRKTAMDKNKKMIEIAEYIISVSEMLET
jgi:response regulator NasT